MVTRLRPTGEKHPDTRDGHLARIDAALTHEDFAAAQAADKPILIDVTASWCPTCRAQKPILAALLGEARFAEFVLFEVDYDRQKDVVRRFAVRMQSTLIVLRGQDELGRSIGDTNRASIVSLLEMAL